MMKSLLTCFIIVSTVFLSVLAFSPSALSNCRTSSTTTELNVISRREALTSWCIPTAIAFKTLIDPANAASEFADSSALLVVPPVIDNFQGIYSDPNHPKGYRVILSNGGKTSLELQDEPKGEVFNFPVKVKKSTETGTQLIIDFSAKGGPKDIIATVRESGIISFSDGNKWKKNPGIVDGIYSDPNHPKGYRIVRGDAVNPSKLVVVLDDDSSGNDVVTIPGRVAEGKKEVSVFFDFRNKGGPQDVVATYSDGIITFPDGNTWTRL